LEALMREGGRCTRRLFVVGAEPGSHEAALELLRSALPTWTVGGVDGYGPVARNPGSLVDAIAEFSPDIVLLALGMPKQEAVLDSLLDQLPPAHYATVGGAVDYIAGFKPLSPRWLGRMGLEWAWRLVHEPRRLGRRYCIEPLHLLVLVLKARIRRGGPREC
jgi:N-acetylglucosaminyldiphosphoundecaprenol N-acetyl-beta-D-mannosaminyltransferase